MQKQIYFSLVLSFILISLVGLSQSKTFDKGNYMLTKDWKKLVVTSYIPEANPETQSTEHGLKVVTGAVAHSSGSYEVNDYTILFNYSDGRKIKLAFLGAGYDINNKSPTTLRMSFNEYTMTKQ